MSLLQFKYLGCFRVHTQRRCPETKMVHVVQSISCYRPQTKFAKVMFSQVSVCPRVVSVREAPWTEIPWTETPRTETPPGQKHPGQRPPGQRTPRQRPPWTETSRTETSWIETPWTETPTDKDPHLIETPLGKATCGRYASYWNAFLIYILLLITKIITSETF